jgi:hypothetical protein
VTEHIACGRRPNAASDWPVVAVSLLGPAGLIVVSILAAQRKADIAYAHLDSLNTRYREVETRLRRMRSGVHLSGILARITCSIRRRPRRISLEARCLPPESDRADPSARAAVARNGSGAVSELRRQLDEYWRAYAPLFDATTHIDRYSFLRREIVPRRDEVMRISAEIESINTAPASRSNRRRPTGQRELHQYLSAHAAASLALGHRRGR